MIRTLVRRLAFGLVLCACVSTAAAQRTPPPTPPKPPTAPTNEDNVPRKVIGYVDGVDFDTGIINGWACAVGESRPITVVFHAPPFLPHWTIADQPNEAIINSPQYCDASGSHR